MGRFRCPTWFRWTGSLVALVAISGCQQGQDTAASNEEPTTPTPTPQMPAVEPPLDRAALLRAVAEAASAAALGQKDEPLQRELDGKPFEVRIRFGCASTQTEGPPAGSLNARLDPESRTLKLRAVPDVTKEQDWVAAIGGASVEAVEGFWLSKPWQLNAGCPKSILSRPSESATVQDDLSRTSRNTADTDPGASPAAGRQGIGIAQFYTVDDSRTRRRDHRPYDATVVLAEDKRASPLGYDLVLAGRLRALPGRSVINCRVESADLPPKCIVSATFDQVRMEDAANGKVLAEWGS